ncbi:hypothetical protein [Falsiroseomonas sp. E2-1-a20]|uniref:hypothetical protein n=1 Tax=Falsiroseomonas sp. E2-1-a20 TaxID=3239300 RepID=UPI003F354BFF
MNPPGQVDPDVLRQMRTVLATAIGIRTKSLAEAAAEARGLGCGMLPALPVSVIDEAVAGLLREVGAHRPAEASVELDGRALRPVTPEEVADTLAYAMRFNERGKARRTGHEYASKLAAEQLVQQMLASGYVILRRPPAPHGSGPG